MTSIAAFAAMGMMSTCDSVGPGCLPRFAADGESASAGVSDSEFDADEETSGGDAGTTNGPGTATGGETSGATTGSTSGGVTAGEAPYCGDGVVQGGEECDDGNLNDGDGCTNMCMVAVCGDGCWYKGVEECDDGNDDDTDACRNNCETARCGDGVIRAKFETCDDGNVSDQDACSSTCQPTRCGDGIVQNPNGEGNGEACDGSVVPEPGVEKECHSCEICVWNKCALDWNCTNVAPLLIAYDRFPFETRCNAPPDTTGTSG